ncbi:MAG TPA: GTP-binding protein [Fluviicoccus sp.]|nr:GTP-binding protein [Fluviicoccus sp.]
MQPILQAIPANIITGFLGAGKTTLIRSLLQRRPAGERWAVLVNEFGQIGIDGSLIENNAEGIHIKEVAGGCICCANFLPMQVALSQLLAKARPQRLLIEPTGLGHPRQIVESLTEDHWRSTLDLRATLCVVDARQLADARVTTHETFLAQADIADVLVFSKDDLLDEGRRQQARDFAAQLPPPVREWVFSREGDLSAKLLDLPRRHARLAKRSLLHARPAFDAAAPAATPTEPPYHYHQQALDREVGGWVFPADWRFRHDDLLNLLFACRADRIKGVFHTDKGWLEINLTGLDAGLKTRGSATDSRIELIVSGVNDWESMERSLLSIRS